MSCEKCKQNPIMLVCAQCEAQSCPHGPIKDHVDQHPDLVHILCQQCQENSAEKYCQNCEQYLCIDCSQKIHNKAKRAKHTVNRLIDNLLEIKQCYLFCADCISQKEGFIEDSLYNLSGNQQWRDKLIFLQSRNIKLSKPFPILSFKQSSLTTQQLNTHLNCYPFLTKFNVIQSVQSKKLFTKINTNIIPAKVTYFSLNTFLFDNQNDSFRINNSINQSSSTENSMRKRSKKTPISYFQPWIVGKTDKKRIVQQKLRQNAQKGILMIKKESPKQQDEILTRTFSRNIGEFQVEYISMQIQAISIELLCWIIRSIKLDKMSPSQKLILSRLKESFNLKINLKLWQLIIKYIDSNHYAQDTMEKNCQSQLPYILVHVDGDENILTFKNQEWECQDKGILSENSVEWKQFVEFLYNYFLTNSQIDGGRYGCVQYVKLKSMKPLKDCSLGKISLFVQEAINRGIIRYHKTLLVSNNDSQSFINNKSLEGNSKFLVLHQEIKSLTIQIKLIELLLQNGAGKPISLAQIPLNLKKKVLFELNIVQLGFPKWKNVLIAISDKLCLETTKSYLSFQPHFQTNQMIQSHKYKLYQVTNGLLSYLLQVIREICAYSHQIAVEELYLMLNYKIGFAFDYRIFNFTDFCQFIAYYCQQILQIHKVSGVFIAYSKVQYANYNYHYLNPQLSRPQHSQYKPLVIQTLKWQSYQDIFQAPEGGQCFQCDEQESYSDFRCIQKVLEDDYQINIVDKSGNIEKCFDDSVNKSQMIEKSGSHQNDDIILSSIDGKSDCDRKEFGVNELELINQVMNQNPTYEEMKSPRAHIRVNSQTSTLQKTGHNRVHSNLTTN